MTMSGRIGLAVLTSSRSGSHVLPALANLRDHVTVRCLLDNDVTAAAMAAERHGVETSWLGKPRDWGSVCRDDSVDAMLVCSPHANVNMVRRALQRGKSVLCDQPVSLQPSALMACYEEADSHKAHLLVGFRRRYDPVMRQVKSQLASGLLGTINTLKSSVSYLPPYTEPEHTPEAGAGDLLVRECLSQEVDALCWLLDSSPRSVYGAALVPREQLKGQEVRGQQVQGATSAHVVLKFDDIMATVDVNEGHEDEQKDQLEISGTKGTLLLTTHSAEGSSSLSTRLGGGDWRTVPGPGLRGRDTAAFSGLLHRLLHAIKGDVKAVNGDRDQSLTSVCVTAACHHSLLSHQTVTLVTPDTELPDVLLKRPLWKERPAAWF